MAINIIILMLLISAVIFCGVKILGKLQDIEFQLQVLRKMLNNLSSYNTVKTVDETTEDSSANSEPPAYAEPDPTPEAVVTESTEDENYDYIFHSNFVEEERAAAAAEAAEAAEAAKPEEPQPMPTPKPRRPLNIEKIIGENLFGKIGILALVLGIGFFVKLAIDNNWINEVSRTILGMLTGFGLWGIAYRLRDSYRSFSSVLAGGGFAVCYVTIAVAYNFYEIFSGPCALIIFVALSAIMTWIALRYNRRELAMTAIFGGYLAPFLSAGESGSVPVLLAYTALLTAALCVISYKRNWWELPIAGAVVTWIIVCVSSSSIPEEAYNSKTAVVCFSTLYFTMFTLPIVTVMRRSLNNKWLYGASLLLMLINPLAYIYFAQANMIDVPVLENMRGFAPIYVAIIYIACYLRYYHMHDKLLVQTALQSLAVIAVAVAIPLQFASANVIEVAFALYPLLLTAISCRTEQRIYSMAAAIVTVLDWYFIISNCDFLGGRNGATTALICGASYIAMAVILITYKNRSDVTRRLKLSNYAGLILNVGCALVTIAAMEYAHEFLSYEYEIPIGTLTAMLLMLGTAIYGKANYQTTSFMTVVGLVFFGCIVGGEPSRTDATMILYWCAIIALGTAIALFARRNCSDGTTQSPKRSLIFYAIAASAFVIMCVMFAVYTVGMPNYYSAAFSVGVILAGAGLMVLGLQRRKFVLRMTSLVLFGVLLVKLVAYDLWRLPMVGRIVVFILLGVVLLSLSFLYQKLKNKLFAQDNNDN